MTWNKNMDDAPRDGTPFLVYRMRTRQGTPEYHLIKMAAIKDEYLCVMNVVRHVRAEHMASFYSHWMPLPQPPEVEG